MEVGGSCNIGPASHLEKLLSLIRRVDKAYHDVYDKPTLRYQLRIWRPILPVVGLLAIIFVATIVDEYLVPLSTADKISTGLNIMALTVALLAVIIAMISTFRPQMRTTEEIYIFSKIQGLDPSDYPVVKGLIRMRVKSTTVNLQDIYESDPAVFNRVEILKKLTG